MTLFGFVADDFTGATDALWQFRRFGLSGSLVTDVRRLHDRTDVIGLATTARAAEDPVAVALPALEAVAAVGPAVVQYKVCSTFDSSPERGSIGAVIAALHHAGLAEGPVPVLAAQPEFGRYTWYATHFVRYGDDVLRLDRYPPARDHPVTPATEADLRVRLTEQGAGRVGRLPADATPEQYLARRGDDAFIADATTDAHLHALGHLLLSTIRPSASEPLPAGRVLWCAGSGGLSQALAWAAAERRAPMGHGPRPVGQSPAAAGQPPGGAEPLSAPAHPAPVHPAPVRPAAGQPVLGVAVPVLVVSGSRSPVTARQIAVAARAGWEVVDVAEGLSAVEERLRAGRHTIVQSTLGPLRAPEGIGETLGRVAVAAVRGGWTRRVVVAGGDTSGQVVAALGAYALDVAGSLAVGGPVCVLSSDDPVVDGLEVALKGGQVGADDFFLRAAEGSVPALGGGRGAG
ncbi:four-carbon acid sugar kinase family protein [Nonomuraea sp. NPDC049419]|uniref:four-carbon acid sugar kinase family protein n=1 Tax=Nonomuraea sp. NPDC049419 TaxID=3155772 RepID=UPI003418B409